LSERERALCTVAEKMSLTPREMTAADWQPLRDLGFDDEGLLEVGHLIAIFNYFPRMADGFGLKPDRQIKEAGETGTPLRRPS
jgi:alkylhydroperoxidase family enzyme